MSRPSSVPSIDSFRLPKFEFEPWSKTNSVCSQGSSESSESSDYEKTLINFNECVPPESAEDWSTVRHPEGIYIQILTC